MDKKDDDEMLLSSRLLRGLPNGFLMSLCRSFSSPRVAYLAGDKCRCRFFAAIEYSTNVG